MSANATLTTGSSLCAETKKALSLLKHQIGLLESEAMTLDELSRSNARQNPFDTVARPYSNQIEEHVRHLQDRWNFKCGDAEIGGLHVPRPRGYCKTLLVLPPASVIAGMENICAKWREENKFNVLTFADGQLNEKVPNDRRHMGMYALLHKGGRDADGELRNYSFEKAHGEGIERMRGVEVLYFEDFNFRKTGEHLGPGSGTITSSLDSAGFAVVVYWGGWVCVSQYDVQDALPYWGPRAAATA